jgi:hypothetical protein
VRFVNQRVTNWENSDWDTFCVNFIGKSGLSTVLPIHNDRASPFFSLFDGSALVDALYRTIMNKKTGAIHQDEGIDSALDFVRVNALAREIDSKPVVTSKGEQLLNELGAPTAQSESNSVGGR